MYDYIYIKSTNGHENNILFKGTYQKSELINKSKGMIIKFKIVVTSGRGWGVKSVRIHVGFRGIDYIPVLKLGDRYRGFHFIMRHAVVKAASYSRLAAPFEIVQLLPWAWNILPYEIQLFFGPEFFFLIRGLYSVLGMRWMSLYCLNVSIIWHLASSTSISAPLWEMNRVLTFPKYVREKKLDFS